MAFRILKPIDSVASDISSIYFNEMFEVTLLLDGVRVIVDENSIIKLNSDDSMESLIDEKNPIVQGVNNSKLRSLIRGYNQQTNRNIYIEGVVLGDKINNNPDKLVGQHFFLTDIFNRDTSDWISPLNRSSSYMKKSKNSNYSEYKALLNMNIKRKSYLRMVPYFYQFEPFKQLSAIASEDEIVRKLKAMAVGPSFNPSSKRKGLVFKHVLSDFAFKVEV